MSKEERSVRWKWTRNSSQAKKVRQIGKTYMDKVKATKAISLSEKEQKKKKRVAIALGLLEKCKEWGGPVTESTVKDLEHLSEDQLLTEVRCLRKTVAPNIREKRKQGNKFVKFNKEELIFQIQNSIKPMTETNTDVEGLIFNVLGLSTQNGSEQKDSQEPTREEETGVRGNDQEKEESSLLSVGLVGQFAGPLDEVKVGVVVSVADKTMLQLYESKRNGFVPESLQPVPIEEWTLIQEIHEYHYVQYPSRPDQIFLTF